MRLEGIPLTGPADSRAGAGLARGDALLEMAYLRPLGLLTIVNPWYAAITPTRTIEKSGP